MEGEAAVLPAIPGARGEGEHWRATPAWLDVDSGRWRHTRTKLHSDEGEVAPPADGWWQADWHAALQVDIAADVRDGGSSDPYGALRVLFDV